jgi:YD repeat-containing protein
VTAKTTYAYTGGTYGSTLISITDALGHVTTINTATGGGRPKKITDPNSVHTTLSWTPRNWLSSSVLATSAGNLTTSFTYDSAGNLTRTTLPDSSYLAYGYDNAHRPTSITNALSESAAITYDSAGDVTQTLWKSAGGVTKRQHTATYDALGRKVTDVGGMGQTASFTYDSNGHHRPFKPYHLHFVGPVEPPVPHQGRGAEYFQHHLRQPQPPAHSDGPAQPCDIVSSITASGT